MNATETDNSRPAEARYDADAALAALRRAAEAARKTASQTNTAVVVWKDGQMLRLSADEADRLAGGCS